MGGSRGQVGGTGGQLSPLPPASAAHATTHACSLTTTLTKCSPHTAPQPLCDSQVSSLVHSPRHRDAIPCKPPMYISTVARFQAGAAPVFRVVSQPPPSVRKFDRGLSDLLHSELHWLDIHQRVQYKLGVTVPPESCSPVLGGLLCAYV